MTASKQTLLEMRRPNLPYVAFRRLGIAVGHPSDEGYRQWMQQEYSRLDHLLLHVYRQLVKQLPDSSTVFQTLNEMFRDIDEMTVLANNVKPTDVIVIGDSRYIMWPTVKKWWDTWECRYVDEILDSLSITTAIHLANVMQQSITCME